MPGRGVRRDTDTSIQPHHRPQRKPEQRTCEHGQHRGVSDNTPCGFCVIVVPRGRRSNPAVRRPQDPRLKDASARRLGGCACDPRRASSVWPKWRPRGHPECWGATSGRRPSGARVCRKRCRNQVERTLTSSAQGQAGSTDDPQVSLNRPPAATPRRFRDTSARSRPVIPRRKCPSIASGALAGPVSRHFHPAGRSEEGRRRTPEEARTCGVPNPGDLRRDGFAQFPMPLAETSRRVLHRDAG